MASGDRRNQKIGCAISLKAGMFSKELTGTSYPGYNQPKQYYTKAGGKAYTSISAEVYIHFLKDVLKHAKRKRPALGRSDRLTIVHDRARQHTAKVATTWLVDKGIGVVLLPRLSLDLDPLDYGIFGPFKTKLQREAAAQKMDWAQRCNHANRLLQECDVQKTIKEFRIRMEAVLKANGGHIDSALKELKKAITKP